MWFCRGVIVMIAVCLTAAQPDRQYDYLCATNPTKYVVRHPDVCSNYVECLNGISVLRSCGSGLHYNEAKGVCDYPEHAGCVPGKRPSDKPYLGPQPPTFGAPPSLGPPSYLQNRGPVSPNYRNNIREYGNEVSHRVTYEETVYGAHGRDTKNGQMLRGYGSVLLQDSKKIVKERMQREISLYKQMYDVVDSAPFRMVSRFLNARPYAKSIAQAGMVNLEMMKLIKSRFGNGADLKELMLSQGLSKLLNDLPGVYEPDTPMPSMPDIDYCPYPRHMSCSGKAIKYRMIDGSCNNLNNPIWGRSMTPFGRLISPRYADGIEEFRRSVHGGPLPGARHVSSRLFPDADIPQSEMNMMMVFFGQLVDHDLTLTAITEVPVDETMKETKELKCGTDGCQTSGPGLEACAPIPVPKDDSDFPYNRCLKFVRSLEVPRLSCEAGAREQLNQATHWVDASMVYGVTKEDADKLRDLSDRSRGRMALRKHPDERRAGAPLQGILPSFNNDICRGANNTHSCFLAGDERVNENAGLTVFHTALIREHNRIESALRKINSHWDGERLYEETRRILVAYTQHVTYNEWLPLILGERMIKELDLEVLPTGYYRGYNPTPDPHVPNAFGAAAFRFGHTLLEEKIRRMNEKYEVDDSLFLSETFNRPVHSYSLEHGGLDAIARGLANLPCQSYDQFFTKQVTRHLFTERPPFGPSMDLVSLNIQRGRDHGIGTYNDFRELCGLGRAKSFDDLRTEVQDERALNALRGIYEDVEDIDLFAGGVSERALADGQVGPTFACIIGRTFRDVRRGDRFWYENDNESRFTPAQLQEIRKVTMSKIMCVNMDNMYEVQKWFFMLPTKNSFEKGSDFGPFAGQRRGRSINNPIIPCDAFPDVNLEHWADRPNY